MQYRLRVGGGPSPNTWPRWDPHLTHLTARLRSPQEESHSTMTFESTTGLVKLGQPVFESYLSIEEKTAVAQPTHR